MVEVNLHADIVAINAKRYAKVAPVMTTGKNYTKSYHVWPPKQTWAAYEKISATESVPRLRPAGEVVGATALWPLVVTEIQHA